MIRLFFMIVLASSFFIGATWASESEKNLENAGGYLVPVPPELEAHAFYPIQNICWNISGEHGHLEYDLPVELTGLLNHIVLDGEGVKGDTFTMKNENDRAQCTRDHGTNSLACLVIYPALTFDEILREQIIKNRFVDETERGLRSHVSAIFSTDPVGIVKFSSLPAGCP